MFTGVRAVCACGAAFPLPQEAFTSGTTCPGCGHEVTPSEIEAYRPPGVSRFTQVSSITALAALVLGQIAFLARGFLGGEVAQLAETFRDLGRSLPVMTTLILRPGLVPGILVVLAIACVTVAVAGAMAGRARGRRDLGAPAVLLALLAIVVFLTTTITFAIRLPLTDLIRSLD